MRSLIRRLLLTVVSPLLPLRICGVDRVPMEGRLLVVSNHVSNADPPILELAFPRPLFFLGKSELFGVPVVGWFIRRFGGHPIERGAADRAALRHARTVIEQEIAMGVFPEGGRSRSAELVSALPGVGLLALQTAAPVLPVAITGSEFYPVNGERPPGRPTGDPRGVTVQFGTPFVVPQIVDGNRVTSAEATKLIMHRIADLLPERYRGFYGGATPSSAGPLTPLQPPN
jgi:1-acyl-sn-glycerol-3-phosphate acyltransferase